MNEIPCVKCEYYNYGGYGPECKAKGERLLIISDETKENCQLAEWKTNDVEYDILRPGSAA